MPQSGHFCPKSGHFFPIFEKGQEKWVLIFKIPVNTLNLDLFTSAFIFLEKTKGW